MAHAALPAAPRAPRLLRATLLLLLLLVAADRRAAGAPAPPELRCQCLQMVQGIHSKILQSFNITPPGPNCDRTEVIATLKTGQKICLNPEAPMVKKFLQKMLSSLSKKQDPLNPLTLHTAAVPDLAKFVTCIDLSHVVLTERTEKKEC
ncbi:growth-regulated protein homolog gamma-like [Ochotona curzoniae]|uniref:growth-regulated protein homolog gamma-like n=1 Tax=Ochotona curzoniae TaxID=130825 RepID=UPI001B348F95|nr:growth-regulated protein homolog gamma-like [Ochotona curzoniae]